LTSSFEVAEISLDGADFDRRRRDLAGCRLLFPGAGGDFVHRRVDLDIRLLHLADQRS
jgi:hypothetical protein